MLITNPNTTKFYRRTIAIIFLLSSISLIAQVEGPQKQEVKFLSVSSLKHWVSSGGAEIEYGRRGRAGFLSTDQLDGLNWPAQYNFQDVNVGKSLWIGTKNFEDPVSGVTYPFKVVCAGRLNMYLGLEIFADELTLVGKYDHPRVYVDDEISTNRDFDDIVDVIDESIPSDRLIINKFHTSIGISVTRKIYVFTQQYHDNYYIYEYTFKNTGIIDESGEKKIDRTLEDVVFHWQHRYGFAGESYRKGWAPTGAAWGLNCVNNAIGQDENHPGDFRAIWSYYGPTSLSPGYEEDIGLPNYTNGYILAGTNYAGVVVLHADKSAQDKSDDFSQPFTTQFMPSDRGAQGVDQYDPNLMTRKYTEFMTAGHPAQTHAEQVGTTFADDWGGDAGGYAAAQGFGPYTMAPGDSIRIVLAEAVAGIMKNRERVRDIAYNWFNNTGNYVLPDGSTTTDRNEYKNTWVLSGEDSLMQTFRRAIENYNNGFNIPSPPPPPSEFSVKSGGNKITLEWDGSIPEAWPNFDGYQIFRAEGRPDTTYDMIFSCNAGNAVNIFEDRTAKRGFNYFYYIVTKDDGSTNIIEPGVPLVSSKFYTMTNKEAFLTRPPGGSVSESGGELTFEGDGITREFILPSDLDYQKYGITVRVNGKLQVPNSAYTVVDTILHFNKIPFGTIKVEFTHYTDQSKYSLDEIRIVPNPYYISARDIQFGESSQDRLAFYNLPDICTIKIFTETGDLVETIEHTNGSGDELWNSLTSSKQLVVSGIYIAYFEVPEDIYDSEGNLTYRKGDSTFKKFIVIR